MKPRVKPQDSGVEELFRAKLKNIINLRHELVRLGDLIDGARLEAHFAPYYSEAGRPGLPIRLVVGLHLLKHMEGLSDEVVCERWERDPYSYRFGPHRGATIRMERKLSGLNLFFLAALLDQPLGQLGAFAISDHPTGDVTARLPAHLIILVL
jgi:hypothetical protein